MSTDETRLAAKSQPNGAAPKASAAPFGAQALENGSVKRGGGDVAGAIEEALEGEEFVVSSMVTAARNFGAVVNVAQHRPVVVEKRGVARAAIVSMRRMAFHESLVARYAEETAITELGGALRALIAGRSKESCARRRGSRRLAARAPKAARRAGQFAALAGELENERK
jgi:hypothetical protein